MTHSEPASLRSLTFPSFASNIGMIRGLLIASVIITLWATSLVFLLCLDISHMPVIGRLPLVAWQIFLYTGLFITAHDAMHGAILPHHPRINHWVGTLAVRLYGLFSYQKLLKKHWEHHRAPATEIDPDFHDGQHKNFFAWYFHFMKGYWSWTQLLGLMAVFNLIKFGLHVPEPNLIWFWAVPSVLSSVQLFFFGTFLTHREPKGGYNHPHRSQTTNYPAWLSFITCYHFGYHQEHHEHPDVPWWRLPEVHKERAKAA